MSRCPGLTHSSLSAAAVRLARPDRPVVGEGAARPLAGAHAMRLALTRQYDAVHSHEEGGAIGVVLAWWLGVPHLYDMHSSLPQQVTQLRLRERAWLTRDARLARAADDPALARRDRDLPGPRDDRARARRRRADRADRERARVGRRAGRGTGRAIRAALGLAPDDAGRALHGNVRALSGARPALPRDGRRRARRGRTRGWSWSAASRRRSSQRDARGRRAGHLERRHLHRPAAGRRDSRLSRRGDGARVAAIDGHEHAAQDLPIPPVGPAHRRHQPAHAHAGADGRDGVSRRADAGGVWRCDSRGARRPGARRKGRRRARDWPRRIQRRGVHRQDAACACGLLVGRTSVRRSAGGVA